MNEQFSDLEAPDLDFPNDDLHLAFEFFLTNYLHPYDIAVELFDFPEIITDPFNDYQFRDAFKNNLITKKQFEDYAVIYILNQKFEKFAQSRSIEKTNFKTAIEHYWNEDNVINNSTDEFKQDLRDFRPIDITKYLCAYFFNITLSKQAYIDENFLASKFIYHVALDNLVQLKILLGKNLMLDTNKIYSNLNKVKGRSGGNKKAQKLDPIKEKFLNYHDQHFAILNPSGGYYYNATKAARMILEKIGNCDENGKCEYEENSLANIIRAHRKLSQKK